MNRLKWAFCLVGIQIFLSACGSPVYIARNVDARVVDSRTGNPVQGAIVVAHWELEVGGFDGSRVVGQLAIQEVVTDSDGKFHLDGFIRANLPTRGLGNRDPEIIIFKPGYRRVVLANSYPKAGTETPGIVRSSKYHGKSIKLVRFQGDYEKSMPYFGLDSRLKNIISGCGWKKIPLMIMAMEEEAKNLLSQGLAYDSIAGLMTFRHLKGKRSLFCGSATKYLEKFAKKS